jgi:hypothetical protein
MLPLALIREAAAAKFAEQDPLYLQYGHIYGFPKFRGESSCRLRRRGAPAAPGLAAQLTSLPPLLLLLFALSVAEQVPCAPLRAPCRPGEADGDQRQHGRYRADLLAVHKVRRHCLRRGADVFFGQVYLRRLQARLP